MQQQREEIRRGWRGELASSQRDGEGSGGDGAASSSWRAARQAKMVKSSLAAAAISPRQTRSATARKRAPPVASKPPPKAAKKAKVAKAAAANEPMKLTDIEAAVATESDGEADSSKTIIVEACKQCSSFKKRAEMVKNGLESVVNGITVVINPRKPRRGCFEIHGPGGEVFVSLLGMPRPFKRMKDLDMEQVVADIVKKVA